MTFANTGQTNRLLGYPADARLLIVNADDFGMCHAVNQAIIQTLETGLVSSCSLMVPCPWRLHGLKLLRAMPEVSVGVHLTAISEQPDLRWGMISYEIPLERYGTTYNGQPLSYVALAAQKQHYALYLTCASMDPAQDAWLREQFAQAGKKLDMGKSCLRFKRLADLPLDVIGAFVASTPPEAFIAGYEASRRH